MTAITIDGLRWEVAEHGSGPALLLLHGFTGAAASWDEHVEPFARGRRLIVPDLPGHGRSGAGTPERMRVERTADDLAALLGRLGAVPADVVGYSLGARIALRLAVAHPDALRRLVLESPSAGLETAEERESRLVADGELASRLERDGVEAFIDEWERQPVFASHASLPAARAARMREIRVSGTPAGLAASLRGAGQGAMEPLFDRLSAIRAPTLVLTGAIDDRGRPRAECVAAGIPGARLGVIHLAGHTPHDERPDAFRRLVLEFLEDPAA